MYYQAQIHDLRHDILIRTTISLAKEEVIIEHTNYEIAGHKNIPNISRRQLA